MVTKTKEGSGEGKEEWRMREGNADGEGRDSKAEECLVVGGRESRGKARDDGCLRG